MIDGQMNLFDVLEQEGKILGVTPKDNHQRKQLLQAKRKGFDVGKRVQIWDYATYTINKFFFGSYEYRDNVLHCTITNHGGILSWPVLGKGITLVQDEVCSIGEIRNEPAKKFDVCNHSVV